MNEYESSDWIVRYLDFKSLCADVCGEYIRFYLTTGCDQIRYTHSQITERLPPYSCRLDAEDGSVLSGELAQWRHRSGQVRSEERRGGQDGREAGRAERGRRRRADNSETR